MMVYLLGIFSDRMHWINTYYSNQTMVFYAKKVYFLTQESQVEAFVVDVGPLAMQAPYFV